MNQNHETASVMRSTKTWVTLTGWLIFISAFGSLLAVIDALTGSGYFTMPDTSEEELMMSAVMGIINIIFEVILGYCLIVYASRIGNYLQTGQSSELERALNSHRQFWLSAGIYAIVMMIAMVVMMVVMSVLMFAMMSGGGAGSP